MRSENDQISGPLQTRFQGVVQGKQAAESGPDSFCGHGNVFRDSDGAGGCDICFKVGAAVVVDMRCCTATPRAPDHGLFGQQSGVCSGHGLLQVSQRSSPKLVRRFWVQVICSLRERPSSDVCLKHRYDFIAARTIPPSLHSDYPRLPF